jgi:predicted polyphosphate/ATP-dependent NAD kinase
VSHPIGFLLNPISGLGGRVGLKGTDGVVQEALRRGARPVAPARAAEMLRALRTSLDATPRAPAIHWLTCAGAMGADALEAAGFEVGEICHRPGEPTSSADTRTAAARFLAAGAELVVFCGGDGTARDVHDATARGAPILGVPAGVKMYSGVFGVTPARTARILLGFLLGELAPAEVDVLDTDEEGYRRGEWSMRLHGVALTPYEPSLVQGAKALLTTRSDREAKAAIADDLCEQIEAEPDTLVLLGPGSTVAAIARGLGVEKTLLGIDAVRGGRRVAEDLDEARSLALLRHHPRCRLVLSPIGAQGFVLGRGNQPLSPEVVRRIGRENVVVVATPAKLARTPLLRLDTGDPELDAELAESGYLEVVTGYHLRRLVPVAG